MARMWRHTLFGPRPWGQYRRHSPSESFSTAAHVSSSAVASGLLSAARSGERLNRLVTTRAQAACFAKSGVGGMGVGIGVGGLVGATVGPTGRFVAISAA